MNDFTASNGVHVRETASGTVTLHDGDASSFAETLDRVDVIALREFFQAQADERLGRWRWPENPDYVVYIEDGYAVIVDEAGPKKTPDRIARRHLEDPVGSIGWGEFAARAYFDAHPEPEPKPLPTVEGVYAMHPRVHIYERLIMLRAGQWFHLYTSATEFEGETPTAEEIARTAVNEGRLTLMVPEVSS